MRERDEYAASFRASPRMVLGGGLILLGVAFTLDNLDLVDADRWLRFWPLLLVAFGASKILSGTGASEWVGGSIWMLVGGWLIAYDLGLVPYGIFDLWPLLFVALGITLIARAFGGPRTRETTDIGRVIHAFAFMSGVERRSSSPRFAGGSLTAIMGGCEVDLTRAQGTDGEARLDCFAFWGGIEVRVPANWTVTSRVFPIMGAFEDNVLPADSDEEPHGHLVLTGWAIMGGVEVKS